MNRIYLALALMLAACSGTESGNPTRTSACSAPIELDVSTSNGNLPDQITVNGIPVTCAVGHCELMDRSFRHVGDQTLVVSATGYADTTITVTVPPGMDPECETASVRASVVLDPSP